MSFSCALVPRRTKVRARPPGGVIKIRAVQPVDGHLGILRSDAADPDPLGEEADVAVRGFQNIKVLTQQRFPSLLFWGDYVQSG